MAPHRLRLGRRIRRLRVERELSQVALAKLAKVAPEHLNRIEQGRHAPTTTTLLRLAKALGVPVTALLE